MRAICTSLGLGCFGIKFDVRATADRVLVVNHDPTLEKLESLILGIFKQRWFTQQLFYERCSEYTRDLSKCYFWSIAFHAGCFEKNAQ